MSETDELLAGARGGDPEALGRLFTLYQDRLRRALELRFDHRLQGRIDPADVLQETFLEATRRFSEYRHETDGSFFVWLRCIALSRLVDLHRRHLGAQTRDIRREVSLEGLVSPDAPSGALAAQLLGDLTSPSEAAQRAESAARIQSALERMPPQDREILALRHFEQLTNIEAAQVLGIEESAASKRHLRALSRLKDALKTA